MGNAPRLVDQGPMAADPRNPQIIRMHTADAGALAVGDAISIDTTTTTYGRGNSVTESDPATTPAHYSGAVGCIAVAADANASGQVVSVQVGGFISGLNVDADVKAGDLLLPGSTKGRFTKHQAGGRAIINGGAAGNHTVTGIRTTDNLLAVYEQDGTSGLLTDRSSEFSITAANTINNGGGTDTSGNKLVVEFERPGRPVARALTDASSNACDAQLLDPYNLGDSQ